MNNAHEVIHNGMPKLANMTKTELNVFCKSLLDILIAERQAADKPATDHIETPKNKF